MLAAKVWRLVLKADGPGRTTALKSDPTQRRVDFAVWPAVRQ